MVAAERRVPAVQGQVQISKGRVLVAIPCYNEEHAIAEVVRLARPYAEEVLVIDDGSQDKTAEVATFAGATVVRNPGNRGKGYGIRRAFQYAYDGDFDALVLMDGDMQHDPREIPNLLDPLLRKDTDTDVALGFRFGASTEMPWWRRMGKRVLDYATAFAGAGIVTDSQCGYRAFGKRAIEKYSSSLTSDGFEIESEQLVIAREASLKLQNVPISCRYEGLDSSTLNPVSHALRVLKSLTRFAVLRRPLAVLLPPSLLLVLSALAGGLLSLQFLKAERLLAMGILTAAGAAAILGAAGLVMAILLRLQRGVTRVNVPVR